MRYRVNHDYHFRQWHLLAGEVVELDAEAAEILNGSASSLLTRVADDAPLVRLPDEEDWNTKDTKGHERRAGEEHAMDEPPEDRMVKRSTRRARDRIGDVEAGSAQVMSRATHGATLKSEIEKAHKGGA